MSDAARDQNFVPTLLAVSSADGATPITLYANPATHRLLVQGSGGGGGGTGTWWDVVGDIDGVNTTFTINTEVTSDFLLFLARQPQMQDVGIDTWDYSYTAGGGTTTITYNSPPDASLSGQPHLAFVVT